MTVDQLRRTPGAVIRHARMQRRWGQMRLLHEMRLSARRHGLDLPSDTSLRPMLSRWERGHARPDQINRRLVCEALDLRLEDLGLPVDPDYLWPPD